MTKHNVGSRHQNVGPQQNKCKVKFVKKVWRKPATFCHINPTVLTFTDTFDSFNLIRQWSNLKFCQDYPFKTVFEAQLKKSHSYKN